MPRIYSVFLVACAVAASPAVAAPATTTAAVPEQLDLAAIGDRQPSLADHRLTKPDCGEAKDSAEVVVCGERADRFRLDPAIMAVARDAEARNAVKPVVDAARAEHCSPVGGKVCPGQGFVPISAIALVAAEAALLAVKGEEWREAFRTKPDQYALVREAKEREARRKSRVRIGLGVR